MTVRDQTPDQSAREGRAAEAPAGGSNVIRPPLARWWRAGSVDPAFAGKPLDSGEITVLFTDIEGSTLRWEIWPDAMRHAMQRHDAIIRQAVMQHGGHIFRAFGDAFFAAFGSAAAAVQAAAAAQGQLQAEDFSESGGLKVRMAVQTGQAEARGGDYFGQPLNRAERLLRAGRGGQVLISGASARQLQGGLAEGFSLKSLGRHQLPDIAQSDDIFQLAGPGLEAEFQPLRLQGVRAGNLPEPLNSFVGRKADAAALAGLIARERLVTVTGAGGIGKTRLTIETARAAAATFPDGVWFVELAGADSGTLAAETLCRTLGASLDTAAGPLDSAIQFLSSRRALLVLDNCEHVIGDAALLAKTVLTRAPGASILASSREPLSIEGEAVFRLGGLGAPPEDAAGTDFEAAAAYDAMQLFAERAQRKVSGFALTPENAADVARICRALDGLPLAIEMAAARLPLMPPAALADEIASRIDRLGSHDRTLSPRQKSLAGLIGWSYGLLSAPEKQLFDRLSIFPGCFTFDAAKAVAAPAALTDEALFELLNSLSQKSLISAEMTHAHARYRMLETTRHFAAARLGDTAQTGMRAGFIAHYLKVFSEADAAWPSMPTARWLEVYAPELSNLRQALDFAFADASMAGLAAELTSCTLRLWDELALISERNRWFARAGEIAGEAAPPDVRGRLWMGRTSVSAHGDRANYHPSMQAAACFRASGRTMALGEALSRAGAAVLTPSHIIEAEPYFIEAIRLLRPLGPSKPLAGALKSASLARSFAKDLDRAVPLNEESVRVASAIGDDRGLVSAQINLAELCFSAGRAEEAAAHAGDMLEAGKHNRRQQVMGLTNLASYQLHSGKPEEARAAIRKALPLARALGQPAAVARLAEHAALLALESGETGLAARLAGFARAFYAKGTSSREFTEQATLDKLTLRLPGSLLPDALSAAIEEGAGFSEAQAVAEAARA